VCLAKRIRFQEAINNSSEQDLIQMLFHTEKSLQDLVDNSKGLSFPVILIIGSIISTLLVTAVSLIHIINLNYKPSLRNAERLMQRGRFEEALSFINQINSDSSEVTLLKAELYFYKALQQRKDEKWKTYGTNESDWFRSKEIDSAVVQLKKIVESEKDGKKLSKAYYYLGHIYSEKGWFHEAEKQYEKVLQIDQNLKDARLGLSSVYVKLSRFSEAERLLRGTYLMLPDDPDVAKNMAYLYRYYIDLPESAIVWLNRYLNNARPRDLDINHCKNELEDLLQRYPEYHPTEPQNWRRFKNRVSSRLQ
jgi:tetratricopeptide (TPR) repeat protein